MEPSPEPSEVPPTQAEPSTTAASAKGAAPATKATKATKASKATKATKATRATKATKSTSTKSTRATKAGRTRPRPTRTELDPPEAPLEVGEDPAADPRAAPPRRRGPFRTRALYNRTVQRSSERWPLVTRAAATLLRHPDLVLALFGDRAPVERDGRVLNRNTQAMLALVDRFGPSVPAGTRDPVTMRNQLRMSARVAMPVRTDVHVSGRTIPGDRASSGIAVRVYRQFGVGVGAGPGDRSRPPAIVYFHGGGWVVGGVDTHDNICRLVAAASGCLVVSVDYRLAPEHPFPAAVDDCLAAYAWVRRNGEELGIAAGQVGVMGDSAGGTLAAVVAQQTLRGADDVPPPTAQGLIYPAVDSHLDTESLRSVGDDFMLTRDDMEFFRAQYLLDRMEWDDPRASPLLADDLTGLPPALVVTAGFDPLRDDGLHYAEALRKGGVEVEYRCYPDQIHGFMGMGFLPDSLALATEVCDAMGRLMRRSTGVVDAWS